MISRRLCDDGIMNTIVILPRLLGIMKQKYACLISHAMKIITHRYFTLLILFKWLMQIYTMKYSSIEKMNFSGRHRHYHKASSMKYRKLFYLHFHRHAKLYNSSSKAMYISLCRFVLYECRWLYTSLRDAANEFRPAVFNSVTYEENININKWNSSIRGTGNMRALVSTAD